MSLYRTKFKEENKTRLRYYLQKSPSIISQTELLRKRGGGGFGPGKVNIKTKKRTSPVRREKVKKCRGN